MSLGMIIHNADIAAIFNEIADLLELEGDNPFRIRAYRNAARTLNAWPASVQTMVEEKRDLKKIPGNFAAIGFRDRRRAQQIRISV